MIYEKWIMIVDPGSIDNFMLTVVYWRHIYRDLWLGFLDASHNVRPQRSKSSWQHPKSGRITQHLHNSQVTGRPSFIVDIWLVVWNIWIIYPYIGKNHTNWQSHIFQRGRAQPPTRLILTIINHISEYNNHMVTIY